MEHGKIIPADGAHPILLNGSEDIWSVETGAVDIFAVPLAAAVPAGAREHICRIGPGQAFHGLGAASREAQTGLLAVGLPRTQLLSLERSDPALIDAWLAALTGTLTQPLPHVYRDAAPVGRFTVKPDEHWCTRGEVVWLIESSAEIFWMPAQQPLSSGVPFPLTQATWLATRSEGEISFQSTPDVVQAGRLEAGLVAFNAAFLEYLRQRRARRDESAQQRLALKHHADDQAFGNALGGLAGVLATEDDRLQFTARTGDNLIDACQLVMEAGGLHVQLRSDTQSTDGGGRIEQLAHQARAALRQVTLSSESWWREDVGPLLGFRRDDGSPVALLPAGGNGYLMVNPATGTRAPLDRESAAGLADTAVMFFRTFPNRAIGMLDLVRFGLAGTGRDVSRLFVFGALGGLLALFTPVATGFLIDSVIPNAQGDELVQLVLLLLAATLGVSAFELTRAIAMLRIEGRMGNATQAAIIERLLHLPAPFFRNYAAGDLAQRAFGIASILNLLTSTTQTALLGWIFGLFSYAYLFFVSWQLALLATVLVAVLLIFTVALNFWRLKLERQMFQVQGNIASRVFQILNGIGKLRASGAEKRAFSLWAAAFTRQKTLDFKTRRIGNYLAVFNGGYRVLAMLLLFAAVALVLPDISTGNFLAFNTAFAQFLAATIAMIVALTDSLNAVPLYERAKPILSALPETSEMKRAPGELSGAIDISHVSFRYTPDGPLILDDVSIKIDPGEFVAFVGPSGSGKSTLFRLLLGFEQPESGAIYYDNQDLAGLDIGAVRRQLGVVLQSGKLMPGDIFTNIVGASPLTLEDAWEAARMAGFEDDIKSMPMGMHTIIAEGAGTISGGQKQRLMVARAIVKKPRILLFDEATSALDNRTQAIVAESVGRLNATRVVIAHRLSTIIKADRIFVVESGRVIESGNYEELMAQSGHFAELAKRQLA